MKDLSHLYRSQDDLPQMIDRLTARGIRVVGAHASADEQRVYHVDAYGNLQHSKTVVQGQQ